MTEEEIYNILVGIGNNYSDSEGTPFYQAAWALARDSGYDMNAFDKAVSRYMSTRTFSFGQPSGDPTNLNFAGGVGSGGTDTGGNTNTGGTDTDTGGNPMYPNYGNKRAGQPRYGNERTETFSVIPPALTLDDIRVAGRPLMTEQERQQYLPQQNRRWWEVQQRPAYSPTPGPMLNFDTLPPVRNTPVITSGAGSSRNEVSMPQNEVLSPQDVIANIVSTSPRGEIAAQRITDYAASEGLSSQDIASALTPDVVGRFGIQKPVTADQVTAVTTRFNMPLTGGPRIEDPTKRLQSLATKESAVGRGDYTEQERAFRIVDEARRQGLNLNQLAGVFGVTPEKVTKVAGRLGVDLAGFANGGEASSGIGSMLEELGGRFQDFFKPSGQKALENMSVDDIENMTIQQAKSAMEIYERMMKEAGNDQEAIRRAQQIYKAETDNISDDTMLKAVEQLRIDRNRTGTAPFAQGGIVDDRTVALNQRYGGLGSMTNQMGGMINSDMVSSIDRIMERQRG